MSKDILKTALFAGLLSLGLTFKAPPAFSGGQTGCSNYDNQGNCISNSSCPSMEYDNQGNCISNSNCPSMNYDNQGNCLPVGNTGPANSLGNSPPDVIAPYPPDPDYEYVNGVLMSVEQYNADVASKKPAMIAKCSVLSADVCAAWACHTNVCYSITWTDGTITNGCGSHYGCQSSQ